MSKTRKPGGGRKPLPKKEKKIQVAFRAEPVVVDALKLVADRNDRIVSAEILHAVKKHLREHGELPEVA